MEFETLLRAYSGLYEKTIRELTEHVLLLKQQLQYKENERARIENDLRKHTQADNVIRRLLAAARTVADRPISGKDRQRAMGLLDDAITEAAPLVTAL